MHWFFIINTILSIIVLVADTSSILYSTHEARLALFTIETFTVAIFFFEFLLHLISLPSWNFLFRMARLMDVLAIFPYVIEVSVNAAEHGNDFLSATYFQSHFWLRLLRLARLAKLGRLLQMSDQLKLFTKSIRRAGEGIVVLSCILAILNVLFASLLFYAEQSAEFFNLQDNLWHYNSLQGPISPFQSISSCFWVILSTLTTVGFGDQVPQTTFGRLIVAGAMMCSMFLVAFPLTMITLGYQRSVESFVRRKQEQERQRLKEEFQHQHSHDAEEGSVSCIDHYTKFHHSSVAINISHLDSKHDSLQITLNTDDFEDYQKLIMMLSSFRNHYKHS